ncbi:MAG: hypothetical protein HYU66_23520 [Armatimonadetes bacterium]|nr:hypothetical protein [Armatimonadota bacterium]
MATSTEWLRAAQGHLKSAEHLLSAPRDDRGYVPSCLSRAYYAAYAACCGWFAAAAEWFEGKGDAPPVEPELAVNPRRGQSWWYPHGRLHADLAAMFAWRRSLCGDAECGLARERHCVDVVMALQDARVDADYSPGAVQAEADAQDAFRHASFVPEWMKQQVARLGAER